MIAVEYPFRIVASIRGSSFERVEDLGIFYATTGDRAKRRAIAAHAARLGFVYVRRGRGYWDTGGWTFRIQSARSFVPTALRCAP